MIRAALRSLIRQPAFTFAAAGILAVGIASTTTLYTTVNAALLRPLPYARPGDLYSLHTYFTDGRFTQGLVASEELAAVDALRDTVASTAYATRLDGAIDTDAKPLQVVIYAVSPHFFDLFAVPVDAGRPIGVGDGARGAPQVAVLSHAIWRQAFGAQRDIVGRLITLAGRPVRVIGVARPGFDVPMGTDVWINTPADIDIGHNHEAWVRARPGTSLSVLVSRMNRTFIPLVKKYPAWEQDRAYDVRPLLDATVGSLGPILVILFAATALLLGLAAVNVTNLILARTTGRTREVAVRSALGASRARLITQLVTESVVIALVGAVVGTGLAYGVIRLLLRFGASRLPRLGALSMDVHVLVFVAVVAGVTGVLVGIVPAVRLADTEISALMNESGRSVHGSRKTRRLLGAFVVAEIAVAVAIVAGAGRLVRSYQNLERLDPGFRPGGLLALDVTLPPPAPPVQERRDAWWDDTETALRAAGATEVAATSSLPLEPHEWDNTMFVDLAAYPNMPPERQANARRRMVTPDFFRMMRIALADGRQITRQDGIHSQPVVMVNEAFARRNFGTASVIGEQIKSLHGHMENGKFVDDLVPIVGVVRDVKYATLSGPAEPVVYLPFAQFYFQRATVVVATADGVPERHAAEFEAAMRRVEPRLAIEAQSVPSIVAASLDRERLGMWLMLGFGAAALVLAAAGIFGVIAYVVSQRIGEMAVRQALGATRAQILVTVAREAGALVAGGLLAGVGVAWWTGRLVSGYIFEVSARDPFVLGFSAAIVAVLALFATLVPARRATSVQLARALRGD